MNSSKENRFISIIFIESIKINVKNFSFEVNILIRANSRNTVTYAYVLSHGRKITGVYFLFLIIYEQNVCIKASQLA